MRRVRVFGVAINDVVHDLDAILGDFCDCFGRHAGLVRAIDGQLPIERNGEEYLA
jgi:hypothetical protein